MEYMEMQERIADYRASGLTAMQWCERTGCSIGRLKYWITRCNKLAKVSEAGGWARVDVVGSRPETEIAVRVGSATVEIRAGFDSTLLSEVLRVVVATC